MTANVAAKFSGTNALWLCEEAQKAESLVSPSPADYARLGSYLYDLAEVLVWCDKHDEAACERALDCGIMTTVERVATNAMTPATVKVQALRLVTILLQNLTRLSSVYFVCSNNHVNRIIAMQLDEQRDDDELVATYTSFLKTVALRLDTTTLQFFFDGSSLLFPLFDKAVKLLTSPDAIIGAAARQVVITVAQLKDAALAEYLKVSMASVFHCICALLQHKLCLLGERIPWMKRTAQTDPQQQPPPRKLNLRAVNGDVEDALDDVYYVNDLLAVTPPSAVDAAVALVADSLLRPMRRVIEQASVPQSRFGNEEGPRTATPPQDATSPCFCERVSPELLLAFMVRWLAACDADSVLARCLVEMFTSAPTADGCVLARILRSSEVELHANAVRLLHVVLQRSLPDARLSPGAEMTGDRVTLLLSTATRTGTSSLDAAVAAVLDAHSVAGHPEWALPALTSSLSASLRQPGRTRLAAVALTVREIQRVLDCVVGSGGTDRAADVGPAQDLKEELWRAALAASNEALMSLAGNTESSTCTQHLSGGASRAPSQVHCVTIENEPWLGPPRESLNALADVFLLAKREDARVGVRLASMLADDSPIAHHDPSWFVPALLRVSCYVDERDLSLSTQQEAWQTVRASVGDAIPDADRVPLTAAEERVWCVRLWLLMRAFLVSLVVDPVDESHRSPAGLRAAIEKLDPFVAHCARSAVSAAPLHTFPVTTCSRVDSGGVDGERLCQAQSHGLYAELAGERYAPLTRPHAAPPGTAVCLLWSENETLNVVKVVGSAESSRDCRTQGQPADGEEPTVLFALDTDFTEAAVCVAMPFKVVIGYNPPDEADRVEIYLVLRHRAAAQHVVADLQSAARAHRRIGAELMEKLCLGNESS